jgi:DNA-binding HxlR family transcriptional regulator
MELGLEQTCGLSAALGVIGGKWKPTILWELHAQPLRFGELRRRVSGISEKVLFEHLREMERNGLVCRDVQEGRRLHVSYSLTPVGAELNSAVHTLAEWGSRYASAPIPRQAAE